MSKNKQGNSFVPVNPNFEVLTIEKFKSFKGCVGHSDEEAIQIIDSLRILAAILLKTNDLKAYTIDNQYFIPLPGTKIDLNNQNKAA